MKIHHCKEYDSTAVIGGSVKYAESINKGLTNCNYNVYEYYRVSRLSGIKSGGSKYKNDKGFLKLLKEAIKTWINPKNSKSDIWIVHHPTMGLIASLARRKRLLYICHGPWMQEAKDILGNKSITTLQAYLLKLTLLTRLKGQKILINRADKVFFLSDYMKRGVLDQYPDMKRNADKWVYINPIVGVENNDKDLLKEKGSIYICRRLVNRTGVLHLIKELAKNKIKFDFTLVIAGDGPERTEIEGTIKNSWLKGKCKMVGFLDEKEHIENYRRSEFMVLPTLKYEGFGLVIVEAIKFNCIPIVSINSGGGYEWISEYDKNLVYDGTERSLFQAINYARDNSKRILKGLNIRIDQLTEENAVDILAEYF